MLQYLLLETDGLALGPLMVEGFSRIPFLVTLSCGRP
jgi:hypothetical protein